MKQPPDTLPVTFGARLRDLREQAGINERELESMCGIGPPGIIEQIESDEALIFTDFQHFDARKMLIEKLCARVNANPDELLRLAGIIPDDVKDILTRNSMAFDVVRSMSILTGAELRLVNDYIRDLVKLMDRDADKQEVGPA